jgi:hypothetical protein
MFASPGTVRRLLWRRRPAQWQEQAWRDAARAQAAEHAAAVDRLITLAHRS